MCPNDGEPLLNKRCDSLYDCEAGSDVTFIVGPEQWRFPGHRSVLCKANPVFRAMLEGHFARPHSEAIPVEDVDGRAFDHLQRYLYGKEVILQSVPTALSTLYAAYKYLCPDLVRVCIAYLDANIEVATVLGIYAFIPPYTRQACAPSAPSLDDTPSSPTPAPLVMPSCDKLLHNCLNFIDHHADQVLSQEDIEELSIESLVPLLSRDSLGVSSENLVFSALNRWCNHECKRRRLELTEENRRKVLGDDALYLVRYLLLRPEEFISGPMQSGWLDQKDSATIMSHILNHNTDSMSKQLEDKWPLIKQQRVRSGVGDFPLSARTGLNNNNVATVSEEEKGKAKKWNKKEAKKDKKRKNSGSSTSPEREKRSTGSKLVECFCGGIAFILD